MATKKSDVVTVDRPVTEEFLAAMGKGVPILGTVTRACKVTKEGERSFRIVLTQGLNRQIRRMCQALGYEVCRLKRVRVMNVLLGGLGPGEYRELTEEERQELYRICGEPKE